jgi:hypothetical protein
MSTHHPHPVARFADLYAVGTRALPSGFLTSEPDPGLVVCVLHDGDGRVYLGTTGLPLVRVASTQPVACAVEDLARTFAPGATIGGLMPISRLRDARDPTSVGAAVVAEVITRDAGALPLAAESAVHRVSSFEAGLIRDAVELVQQGIVAPPLAEIEAVASHPLRHAVHRAAVAPFLDRFSSRLLRQRIRQAIGDADSVIDVSCGDDGLILDLAAEGRSCVGNDVCLSLMRAHATAGTANGITYTLHNVVDLPFAARFSAAICKNTVHHLTASEGATMFAHLDRIADEAVIVDVLDVSRSRRARGFNAYYRRVLGDQGRSFLTEAQFRDRIVAAFPGRRVGFQHIDTIKGRYAMAHVS